MLIGWSPADLCIFIMEEVYLEMYNLERTDYMFATLFPIDVPCLLQKGPGEGVIYLQISEMLRFLLGEGGSTSTLDCVYHCK